MRIMIWCANIISAGGGARLLSHLLPAIARQVDIDLVRLVIAEETQFKQRIDISSYPNIQIVYYSGSIQSKEAAILLQDCHVVYYFWPHGPEYVRVNMPTICTFHDTTILDFVPSTVSGVVIQHCWRTAKEWIEHMTSVIVSSHHVKSRLLDHFGDTAHSASVIEHAILPATLNTSASSNVSLGRSIPQQYMVFPSNISPHKNHYNLLLAFSRWKAHKQFPLILFGHNTHLLRYTAPNWPDHMFVPTLISLMKRTGLQVDQDVYPLGFLPDDAVVPLIQNAKALIMPSMSEGGGSYPVEEALQLGVPVLCSNIPVMREHMSRHSADIIWFDPEYPETITAALDQLFASYDYYKTSALNGMADPTETWDEVASKYIHVFRQAYLKFYGL